MQIPKIPMTIEELVAIRDEVANSPEGGAAVFVLAMNMYTNDADMGLKAFTIALDRSCLVENASGYKGFAPSNSFDYYFKSQLAPKPYIARSYILGTSPENAYSIPANIEMGFSRNQYSEQNDGQIKVFVASSGADTPRPVHLKANNRGIWKVTNSSSLFVGVRPPVAAVDDDL